MRDRVMLIEHFYGSGVFVRQAAKQVRLEIYRLRMPFEQMDAVKAYPKPMKEPH